MVTAIFVVIVLGVLYYTLSPVTGRKVAWIDPESSDEEQKKALEVEKKVYLRALKDIEFEHASDKMNQADFEDLQGYYRNKVSEIIQEVEQSSRGQYAALQVDDSFRDELETDEELIDDVGDDEADDVEDNNLKNEEDQDDSGDDEEEYDDDDFDDNDEYDDDFDDNDEDDEDDQDEEDHDEEVEYDDDDEEESMRDSKAAIVILFAGAILFTAVIFFFLGSRNKPVVEARRPVQVASTPARQFAEPSNADEGLRQLLEYIRENPWNVRAHITLGDYYYDNGELPAALGHFEEAANNDAENSYVQIALGRIYRDMGSFDSSLKTFQALVDTQPDNLEALFELAMTYGSGKGDKQTARKFFNDLLSRELPDELREKVVREIKALG